MSTDSRYIVNGNTAAAINNGAEQGWISLQQRGGTIGFQVNLPATGSPIGNFIFETTDDDNPNVATGHLLGPVIVPLGATYGGATFQPTDGNARLVNFDFGPGQPVAAPSARWMRMRYAPTSGGAATLNVGVCQRGF